MLPVGARYISLLRTSDLAPTNERSRPYERAISPLRRGVCLGDEVAEGREQLVEGACRLASSSLSHGERLLGLAVPVDDDEGDLLELGVADPLPERLVPLVDIDTVALGFEAVAEC